VGALIYPKDKAENLRFRAEILTLADGDEKWARNLYKICSEDILFWFNVFVWTFDPRTVQKNEPFITFPFQDEHILGLNEDIENQENNFTDKSRDEGATWMACGVILYRWLFKTGEDFLLGSRVEDLVDKPNDISTLFGKVRYALEHLPSWMTPEGWEDKKKYSSYMRLTNPENRCNIFGAATSPNFGRGGRYRAILFDEFSVWENADQAWRAASDATRCKMALGTPHGEGGKFAELRRTDEIRKKYHLMWWKHPFKVGTSKGHLEKVMRGQVRNKVLGYTVQIGKGDAPDGCYVDQYGKIHSEWYDRQCDERDATDVAENLDCDYLTTGRPVFDTLKCKEKLNKSESPKFVGDLIWKVSPDFDTQTGYCKNIEQLRVEFVPNNNGVLRVWEKPLEEWENGYCISADVAEGLEQGDYDSAAVLKRFDEFPRVVADIHIKLKTFEYAEVLCKLAVWYGNCIIAPERNGAMGGSLVEQLFKLYNKIYHKEIFTKGYASRTDKLGWETHAGTKGQIIGNLSKMISNDMFIDPDEGFWNETLTFVNNDGTLEAQGKSKGEKCFDDRVMCRAILLWINTQLPLPIRKFKREELQGWRKMQYQRSKEQSLVGWVI
jgi:hypothetical protein